VKNSTQRRLGYKRDSQKRKGPIQGINLADPRPGWRGIRNFFTSQRLGQKGKGTGYQGGRIREIVRTSVGTIPKEINPLKGNDKWEKAQLNTERSDEGFVPFWSMIAEKKVVKKSQ